MVKDFERMSYLFSASKFPSTGSLGRVTKDFELWILDLFSIFLRLIVPKNLAEDNGVVQVSVIEVHIRQKILVQRTEKRRHIGFLPSPVLQQKYGSGNSATGEVVEIDCGNIHPLALCKKALG